MKTSIDIRNEIDALEAKLAPLSGQIIDLRAASETAEQERSSHAFAALVENDADSKSKMSQLDGKPQQLQVEARNCESAIRVGNERLADLRAQLASAVLMEKIQEVRVLCEQCSIPDGQLEKLAAPFLKVVAKASAAEIKLSLALRELGEIVKPRKARRDFDPPLAIENAVVNFGSPVAVLATHVLGSCEALSGSEIGKCDEKMLLWYSGKLGEIERELDRLEPRTEKDAAA